MTHEDDSFNQDGKIWSPDRFRAGHIYIYAARLHNQTTRKWKGENKSFMLFTLFMCASFISAQSESLYSQFSRGAQSGRLLKLTTRLDRSVAPCSFWETRTL